MNLHTATGAQLEDLHLPDEALAALAAGEKWEYTPDSVEGADADVHWCDDCETWHQTWTVWGLSLETDGNLYEVEWSVDTDGDWSDVVYLYGTFDHAAEYARVKARWDEYARWVIDHNGEDPVGNYLSDSGPERVAIALRNLKES